MAFVLSEVATGYPLLVSELTLTTALRTAAIIGHGRTGPGTARCTLHGAHWQRRAK